MSSTRAVNLPPEDYYRSVEPPQPHEQLPVERQRQLERDLKAQLKHRKLENVADLVEAYLPRLGGNSVAAFLRIDFPAGQEFERHVFTNEPIGLLTESRWIELGAGLDLLLSDRNPDKEMTRRRQTHADLERQAELNRIIREQQVQEARARKAAFDAELKAWRAYPRSARGLIELAHDTGMADEHRALLLRMAESIALARSEPSEPPTFPIPSLPNPMRGSK